VVSAAAVVCLSGFVYWLTASRPALSFDNRDWILIADIENRTGDPRFDKALFTALTVSLEQSRYANIFPRSRVYETLQRMGRPQNPTEELTVNEALGREICVRENLRALVALSLTRAGKEYLLTGHLVDPKTGLAVRSYSAKMEGEDHILDALDSVGQSIRRDLGETLYSIRRDSIPVPRVTTSSLTALQLFSEAGNLWHKGKYNDAQTQLLEAVRIDPDFAMAHAALGQNYYSHIFSDAKGGKQEFERALQLSNRISDRERLWIQASFAGSQNQTEEAIRIYHAFLDLYPDDYSARFNLAGVFLASNRCSEAIAQYQELIRIEPSDASSRIKIATCYAKLGRYAEALPYYSKAFELDPSRITSYNLNHEYGFILVGAGQPEKAREVFGLALEKPETRYRGLRSLGLLDLYEGRYGEAAAQLKEAIVQDQALKFPLPEARDRLYLAMAYAGMADLPAAERELRNAMLVNTVMNQPSWLASYIGVALARVGSPDEAAKVLETLKAKANQNDPQQHSDMSHLEAEILLARGEFARSIELFQNSRLADYPGSLLFASDGMARAYEGAGLPEQAISAYESFLAGHGTSPLGWEPQQTWFEDHFLLAKLQASRGNASRAIELLDKLLGIWKNADPDLPLLRQAKALRETLNH
jgi:tetratricopeptide (TPR) repeat protein